ncbi:MAG: hypothetical protein CSH37_14765 [Thalassolituus sp.]|nr:MAG: hypothetical protein CSH37_14765 [Thalassolituus sp.]
MTRPFYSVSRLAVINTLPVRRWAVIPLIAALAACSNDDSRSSVTTIDLDVQVGQEDFDKAMVRRVTVDETGMPSEVQPGVLNFARFTTDDEGQAVVTADGTEIVYLDVYGRENNDGTSTTRRCQLVDGCGSVAFGAQYSIVAAPGWRSVAAGIEDGQRIRVTPLTDLAAQLAFDRVFSESSGTQQDAGWLATGFYSVYSTLQAESQVSRLFGIDSVQSREPADLTQIEEWRGANQTEAQYSIRYGALLAAWQSELSYTSTTDLPSFASAVAADLVANDGQLIQRGGSQTLSMYDLYDAAVNNLNALDVTDSTVSGYVASVISQLQSERDAFVDGDLTSITPASLSSLLGDELEDYQLGIQRTKAFVQELRDYGNSFFEEGYRAQLDSYADILRGVGEDNAENLDEITTAVAEIAGFYRDCYLNSGCPSVSPEWQWYQSHTYSAPVLTLNGGGFEVSQAVADINLLDDNDAPSSSRAIDILMKGTLVANGLRLELDHTYSNDEISSPSGLRIFYEDTVTVLQDEVSDPALAYQIRWTDFTLYDADDVGTANETELTGAFSILYQGVDDPDGVSERRFNISEVVLNSRISDVYEDDNGTDSNITTVFLTANANQASEFYPESEFASFNAFFERAPLYPEGTVANGLVQYRTGTQTVNGRETQYLDYFVDGGDDFRYRFYPTVMREDVSDVDGDGDTEELIATHDYEACLLSGSAESPVIDRCQPKQRLNAEQDLQNAVNELWQLGVFSRPEVPGQGVYFVELPVEAADEQGCLTLAPLPGSLSSLDGTLYRSAQLGLSSARFTSEAVLDYSSATEPKTLVDVQVTAPYSEQVDVSVSLSHDYTSVNTTGLYRGVGADLDRLIFDFSTESGTVEATSLSVFKDGVELSLADGTTDTVDSEIILGSNLSLVDGAPVYRYIVGDDGEYRRCVVSNTAEPSFNRDPQQAVYVLNYRDKVYGKVVYESGVWIIRYIDGTWESLN